MYKHMNKLLIAGLLIAWSMPAAAQEEEPVFTEESTECISLNRVRSTEIVDDKNILFHMSGNVVYHNILPRQCNGLAREDRFSYKVSINRLCRLDTIAVLYSSGTGGLREGNRCGLGLVHKITKEDAEAYKEQLERGPEAEPLQLPEPEEVDDKTDEAADPQPD